MRRLLTVVLLLSVTTGIAQAAAPRRPEATVAKFVVFFQEWSARLDDAARAVISRAADDARAHPGRQVRVAGFADPTGSRKANLLLADLRMQVVLDQLLADGVPATRLAGRGHGPVRFALTSQESRRVEIGLGDR